MSENAGDQSRIILCIPGPWEDHGAFVRAAASASQPSADYLAAGMLLMHGPSRTPFEFFLEPRDPRMADAFAAAGLVNTIGRETLQAIETHRSVVYLISTQPQSPAAAEAIAKAGSALLKAGGLGVKVETAGLAFSADQWRDLTSADFVDVYRLMVLDSISSENTIYSCGMRNLGLPDAIVSSDDFQFAVSLLRSLNQYQLYESPDLKAGHTFRSDADCPRYRLQEETSQPYADTDIFVNPFGMWRLTRATPDA